MFPLLAKSGQVRSGHSRSFAAVGALRWFHNFLPTSSVLCLPDARHPVLFCPLYDVPNPCFLGSSSCSTYFNWSVHYIMGERSRPSRDVTKPLELTPSCCLYKGFVFTDGSCDGFFNLPTTDVIFPRDIKDSAKGSHFEGVHSLFKVFAPGPGFTTI